MTRYLLPFVFGLAGVAVLLSLGVWQLRRLEEKRAYLDGIEAAIAAPPVALPADPDPERDRFLAVDLRGRLGPGVRVLVSVKQVGAGYRLIQRFETDGGRVILADLGFVPVETGPVDLPAADIRILGNLHWPDEVDAFTPDADRAAGLWFARDVPALAAELGTEPVMIVARRITPEIAGLDPLAVDTSGIPNDHKEYAITWFLLALVWAGMTVLLLWRIRRRTN